MTDHRPATEAGTDTDIDIDIGLPSTQVVPGSAPAGTIIETELEGASEPIHGGHEHLGLLDVLVVGSGGREHALVNTIATSPRLRELYVAPGNFGTRAYNVEVDIGDPNAVVAFCAEMDVDLVIVGPEQPLVDGLADHLTGHGINCFGPSAAAARLEGSKSFARAFATRHGIPGPVHATFTDVDQALAWLSSAPFDVVVKADGLAGGKGVVVPPGKLEAEAVVVDFMTNDAMGDSGKTVVLEEKLEGEELSLFGICSASQIDPLGGLTAQDHKRVGDGDTGPNTGGMGAFAPVPGLDPLLVERLVNTFLLPVQAGMVEEGTPYVGVIYAGIMMTRTGPRLIEYNCRFGDPEAQVILPLINDDLLNVMYAAATSQPWEPVTTKKNLTAAAVVVCATGYPSDPRKGVAIPPVVLPESSQLIHAGTTEVDGELVSSGGRVLNAVGIGISLADALDRSYDIVEQLVGEDLFARRDIGWRYARGRRPIDRPAGGPSRAGALGSDAYGDAGVSLAAASATTRRIAASVTSTHDDRVIAGLGSFGGVIDVSALVSMEAPLLVASTDGVGTKTKLAELLSELGLDATAAWSGLGTDIVHHGINDVLVQGARPLFFLDTVSAAQLDPEIVGSIVDGMAAACRESSCVLLGGETAEMPDVLVDGSVDITGTVVGVVERRDLLPKAGIGAGHKLVGLKSSGLHTNGYSLARRIIADRDPTSLLPGGAGESIIEALLATHRSYLAQLEPVLAAGRAAALAHITGGGLIDNLPRVLPLDCGARLDPSSWPVPPIFDYLIKQADLGPEEAHRILNCGIGMVVVAAPEDVDAVQELIDEESYVIGEITATPGIVLS